jgi:hypothetical protein
MKYLKDLFKTLSYYKIYESIINKLPFKILNLKNKHNEKYIKLNKFEKIKIVFLIQYPYLWGTYDNLIKSCLKNPNFKVDLVIAPYLDSNYLLENKYISVNKNILLKNKINFKFYNNYSLEKNKPHVIFIQKPYFKSLPNNFSISKIISLGIRICYIQYGGDPQIQTKRNIFNMQKIFFSNVWCIFSRSIKNKELYKKNINNKKVNIIVTGNPKFDHFFKDNNISKIISKKIKKKKVLFWATGFYTEYVTDDKYCSFDYYRQIFNYIKENKNIFLIFKPHPKLWDSLNNFSNYKKNFYKNIVKEIRKNQNIFYDGNINYTDYFKITDYLISDHNSILQSFLITKKPIIYLKQPTTLLNINSLDMKKYLYIANNIDQLKSFVSDLNNNFDPLKNSRKKIFNQHFNFFNGNSAHKIEDAIIKKLSYNYF